MKERHHDERCPQCGRYVSTEDGYGDREWPYEETSYIVVFCNERCAAEHRCRTSAPSAPWSPHGATS